MNQQEAIQVAENVETATDDDLVAAYHVLTEAEDWTYAWSVYHEVALRDHPGQRLVMTGRNSEGKAIYEWQATE
jgi:hypothetical protein